MQYPDAFAKFENAHDLSQDKPWNEGGQATGACIAVGSAVLRSAVPPQLWLHWHPSPHHRLCVRNSAEIPMMDTDSPSFSSKSAHSLHTMELRGQGGWSQNAGRSMSFCLAVPLVLWLDANSAQLAHLTTRTCDSARLMPTELCRQVAPLPPPSQSYPSTLTPR